MYNEKNGSAAPGGTLMTRKTQKRGSHRPAERRLRSRLRSVIEKQRDHIAELADLMKQEQVLITELDHTSPRSEELDKFDTRTRRESHDTVTQYIVKLTQLRDYTNDFLAVIDDLDDLDTRPRLLPVRDVSTATTEEHITSLLDGSQFQILTRSLVAYDISADDYRRLFGLPDDYLLWTKKVQNTRRGVVLKHRVWDKRRVSKSHDDDAG
ncbi:MucR family transcriptional regulator [Agrobacterium tumefaciens]|uniref:MucR family transcriptional regulator n=1 Tax=Agrobacterium tumefaciens TaxID=358 RepID=UPI001571A187|nr:MucR family transcriptional regulator [Agrobacterium tumefaciens]